MNPFLLATGWAMARQGLADAMHRTVTGAAAYAALIVLGLTAAGFLTAAAFLYLAETHGAIEASLAMAGFYAFITVLGYLLTVMMQARRRRATGRRASTNAAAAAATAKASQGLPGGMASLGLVAAVGYLLARSMTRKS